MKDVASASVTLAPSDRATGASAAVESDMPLAIPSVTYPPISMPTREGELMPSAWLTESRTAAESDGGKGDPECGRRQPDDEPVGKDRPDASPAWESWSVTRNLSTGTRTPAMPVSRPVCTPVV